ncbi:MAG: AAA family ATPase [Pseudomonadota bacterium]
MTVNAMTVSAGSALKTLKAGWAMQNAQKLAFSWMMHGRPGVGKTQVAEALAIHIGGPLYDVRLTQIDSSDLRGLPYYDHENRTTMWYRPEDLPQDDGPAVLFLDEITAADPILQPIVYGLLQERRVGLHKIPPSTMIVAAGNSVEDGAIAFEMGTAISDRLIHMVVETDPADWIKGFAIPNRLHASVIAFIKSRPDMLETLTASMEADHMIAATPRSWERVSHIMTHVDDRNDRLIMIAGTVGTAIAGQFLQVADDIEATVDIEALVAAERRARPDLYPATLHGLNALMFGLVSYLNKDNSSAIIETMLDIGELRKLRQNTEGLSVLPLRELATAGFEMLIERCLDLGIADTILDHPAYSAHMAERRELGLID